MWRMLASIHARAAINHCYEYDLARRGSLLTFPIAHTRGSRHVARETGPPSAGLSRRSIRTDQRKGAAAVCCCCCSCSASPSRLVMMLSLRVVVPLIRTSERRSGVLVRRYTAVVVAAPLFSYVAAWWCSLCVLSFSWFEPANNYVHSSIIVRCEIPYVPAVYAPVSFVSRGLPRAHLCVAFVTNTDRNPETNTCRLYTEVYRDFTVVFMLLVETGPAVEAWPAWGVLCLCLMDWGAFGFVAVRPNPRPSTYIYTCCLSYVWCLGMGMSSAISRHTSTSPRSLSKVAVLPTPTYK